MKKYIRPQINIECFCNEDVIMSSLSYPVQTTKADPYGNEADDEYSKRY